MPERLIPISKKQHDSFNAIHASIKQAQDTLTTVASTILQGIDDDLGQVNVDGVRCVDGVYSLVVQVPESPAQDSTG